MENKYTVLDLLYTHQSIPQFMQKDIFKIVICMFAFSVVD